MPGHASQLDQANVQICYLLKGKYMRKIFLAFLDHGESYICNFLLAFFTIIMFLQIVTRGLGIPLSWSEELCRYSFVWFVFFGAAYAARLAAHNRVTIHLKLLPKAISNLLLLVGDAIWIFFNIVMIVKSIDMIKNFYEFPYVTPSLSWELWAIYCIFPISFGLMTIRIIQVDYIRYILKREIVDADKASIEESKQVLTKEN